MYLNAFAPYISSMVFGILYQILADQKMNILKKTVIHMFMEKIRI